MTGESNFDGTVYDLGAIPRARAGEFGTPNACPSCKHRGWWWTLLDAAKLACTSDVDLEACGSPDFVCLSFYKMFGWPTGLGALLVSRRAADGGVLNKDYFGGGTVAAALAGIRFHRPRKDLSARLEDGTLPFLSILSAESGLRVLAKLGMPRIASHTRRLAAAACSALTALVHGNGRPVCRVHGAWDEATQLRGHLQPVRHGTNAVAYQPCGGTQPHVCVTATGECCNIQRLRRRRGGRVTVGVLAVGGAAADPGPHGLCVQRWGVPVEAWQAEPRRHGPL